MDNNGRRERAWNSVCHVGSAGGYKVGPGNLLCLQQVMCPPLQKLLLSLNLSLGEVVLQPRDTAG